MRFNSFSIDESKLLLKVVVAKLLLGLVNVSLNSVFFLLILLAKLIGGRLTTNLFNCSLLILPAVLNILLLTFKFLKL